MKKVLVKSLIAIMVCCSIPCIASAAEEEKTYEVTSSVEDTNLNNGIGLCTLYDWHTSTYLDDSYRKINGPHNGNFLLNNGDGTHYKTLRVSWDGNQSLAVYLRNNDTGHTTSVKTSKSSVTYTDLVKGDYTVYAKYPNGRGTVSFHITTSNPGR